MDDDPATSPLEALPDTILYHSILPSLDMISLGLLACCSKRLLRVASSDHLWFPLCRGLGCLLSQQDSEFVGQSPPRPWLSWHQLFCSKQNRRCVECRRYTPYVFTLAWPQFRLCERCEQECPKYALVTEREAKGRYLLTDDELWGLPFKKVCHKRFSVYFFAKVDIERASYGMDAQYENGNEIQCGKKVERKGDFDDTKAQEGCQGNDTSKECTNILDQEIVEDHLHSQFSNIELFEEHSGDQQNSSSDGIESSSRDNQEVSMHKAENMVGRDHRREIRKEHKRQVKAAKREKRNLRSAGVLSFSGSPKSVENVLCKTNLDDEGMLRGVEKVSRYALQSFSPGSASPSANELTDVQNAGKFHKWRSKREHVSASSGGFRQGETIGCNLQWRSKSRSDWVSERDWLEVELGPYGFSALELVP
eukprot:c23069_g1_i1 orf=77-1342(+)